ncbi:hypothetical protein FHY05_003327 [Sphingomonas sp. BK580]|nr:hypothetical protein [Sphingomonas sp. BK580]
MAADLVWAHTESQFLGFPRQSYPELAPWLNHVIVK